MKIKQLPKHVYEKIKAGEVIEDYTSVVSELIDNSIDAGATQIEINIDVEKDIISVKDNGSGMDENDLNICYLPHTTSKINEFEDIFKISSLGFRGEALSSISKVSQLKISSSQGDIGHYIVVENDVVIKKGIINIQKGTIVEVSNLFYNYPVRKKFLLSKKNQLNNLKEAVRVKSIPYPEIEFILKINNEVVLSLQQSDLETRILTVTSIKNYTTFNKSFKEFSIKGIITTPFETYPHSNNIYFYINNRHINKKNFFGTLKNSLRDLIPGNSYPGGAILFYVEPYLIDPNIHPAKKDIKINNESVILTSFYNLIKDLFEPRNEDKNKKITSINEFSFSTSKNENEKNIENYSVDYKNVTLFNDKDSPRYKYFGVILGTYIISEIENGIIFIDFHAAHERLRYEDLKKSIEKNEKIELIIPEIIELDYKKSSILDENRDFINSIGFDFEFFGENTIIIRTIPSFYKADEWKNDFLNILENLQKSGIGKSDLKENYLKTVSCRGSYMSGDKINDFEAKTLVEKILNKEIPATCPHGRPLYFILSKEEIKTKFLR
ncbi:MAG TPA: DNA mismatch repair endonuclease MutL [Spirochaetota bacterium]|nr:DNA mismatch repair endonuclease MutL [Spirochaetota bacterium]